MERQPHVDRQGHTQNIMNNNDSQKRMFSGLSEAIQLRSAWILVVASGPIGAQPAADHPNSPGLTFAGARCLGTLYAMFVAEHLRLFMHYPKFHAVA
jgi:hypothetical protein